MMRPTLPFRVLSFMICGLCFHLASSLGAERTPPSCSRNKPRITVKYNTTSNGGWAQSPGFPGNYDANMNCVYTLEVPQDYRMEVTFQNFSMPPKTSGRECDTDYVIIKDGESEGRGRLIGRFCGHERPKSFLSSGRFVWINFVTDDVQSQYAGFKVNFRPIHEAEIARCTKENNKIALYGARGNISSPSYPGLYPPNRECQWNLTAPSGYFVSLNFLNFKTLCPDDRVTIRDVHSVGQVLGQHCGDKLPPSYNGQQLSVQFDSDGDFEDGETGFYGIYKMIPLNQSIDERCLGGTHSPLDAGAGGVIRSPWNPKLYPNNIDCLWHVLAPVGEQVRISFDEFKLEDTSDCIADFLEIDDPSDPAGSKRFCGFSAPETFESRAEGVKIRFKTDKTRRYAGFVARFGLSRAEHGTLPSVTAVLLAAILAAATLH